MNSGVRIFEIVNWAGSAPLSYTINSPLRDDILSGCFTATKKAGQPFAGNPAVRESTQGPVAFRPHLSMGLAFFWWNNYRINDGTELYGVIKMESRGIIRGDKVSIGHTH